MKTAYMETKDERQAFNRKLVGMMLPMAFQGFMSAAVSASDAIMLGFLEQESLSAVSLAGQVAFVFNLFVTVLVQGTNMLAAQYWGKGDRKTVEMVLALAMRYMLILAALFLAAALFIPQVLMSIFTGEEALIARGAQYLRIAGWSYIPLGLSQIYLCIMKNSDKTAKSTVIGSSAMVVNVALNFLLIFGLCGFPAMGIQGAAIATVSAAVLQFGWTLLESRKSGSLKIRPSYMLHMDTGVRRDFNRYTLPIVGNYFFWGGGVTIFSSIIGHLGSDAVAANSIASIVRSLINCVAHGAGSAGAILVGNDLGRNEIEQAKVHAKRAAVLSTLLGAAGGVLLLCLRPFILSTVTLTPMANRYLSGMLLICTYYMVAGAHNSTVIGGIFCAGGKSKFGCICDGVVLWGIIAPLAAMAAFWWNLPVLVVFFIINLDECIKVPVVIWYFRRYTWAQNLTRNGDVSRMEA